MAAASYTTDLTDLANGAVIADGSSITNWVELTGYTGGGSPTSDTDFYIQGSNCISAQWTKTGLGSLAFNGGTAKTVPTNGAVLFWWFFASPPSLGLYGDTDSATTGGVKAAIGNTAAAFKQWDLTGKDFDPAPYGGWYNFAVDPTVTADDTVGSPTSSLIYFGITQYASAQARGQPFALDIIRYGRCEARMTGGDLANGYATFNGFALVDGSVNNRWALIQQQAGSYTWKGLMVFGHGSAVDFRDSNVSIVVANTPRVSSAFNRIEVRQSGSRVDWTGVNITALGTVSRGQFEMVDNATVNFDTCFFTDMSTFKFLSGATVTDTTFRRCGQITPAGATMSGFTVAASTATEAVLITSSSEMGVLTNGNFVDNNIAIKITTAGTYTFDGHFFDNNTYDVENASTGLVTINATNGCNVSTYINSNGGTTSIVNTKSFTVNNIINDTEIRLIRQSDLVELAGAEVVGSSPSGLNNMTVAIDSDNAGRYKATYTYSYAGDLPIYVVAFNEQYQALYLSNSLKAESSTLTIFQSTDRQYDEGSI